MKCIYHGVPKNLEGDYLHPLFILKDIMPHLYAKEIIKYDDHPQRKLLPYKMVPKLNCKEIDPLSFIKYLFLACEAVGSFFLI